ncbi:MAG: class I SAM-dependent methyltransferase [Desulfurococcales archaeon]|nr:class I SAM-dependent methyltransferase [Desulfurococcales archaeon]
MAKELDWRGLVSDIELLAVAGCYEKVNKIMSLGLVNKLRRKAARLVASDDGFYADIGAGPGTSASIIIEELTGGSVLALVDPSIEMLAVSLNRVRDPRVVRLGGLFESLPFSDSSVDGITAMFSYRDAVDYHKALDEMARVLKPDGRLAILDFYRYENRLMHGLIKLYILVMVPIALAISLCPTYLKTYRSFLASIDRMLTRSALLGALRARFKEAKVYSMAPGVAIFYARGPRIG